MGVASRPSGAFQDDSGAHPNLVSHAYTSSDSAATSGIPDSDKYVDKLLRKAVPLPPVTRSNWYREIRWFNLSVIVVTPLVALYGALTTHLETRTFWFSVFYYVFNMIGGFPVRFGFMSPPSDFFGDFQESRQVCPPNASLASPYHYVSLLGYHRLWSHRAYNASRSLEYFLAVAGGGSVQGAIWWWARGHRSHHR